MRTSLAAVLLIATLAGALLFFGSDLLRGAQGTPSEGFDPRFVGTWDLVSFESYRADGETIVNDYVARLVYDESANMLAAGMPRDLAQRGGAGGEVARAGFAYFGSVTLYPAEGRIVHHVTGSPMNGSWVGSDQVRYFEFDGNLLKLSLRDESGRVTGTLTWRRVEG